MTLLFNEWRLLPQRFAVHVPTATAVLADLHLGYTAARQRLGDAIPNRGVFEEMQPLADAAAALKVGKLIVAGDLFERRFDAEFYHQFLNVLDRLKIEFVGLVPGNHDRGVGRAERRLPLFPDGYDLNGWHIVHGDRPIEKPRAVFGHLHPAVRVNGSKQPCFLTRGTHLILPAFSLDAAGIDVSAHSRWSDWSCYSVNGMYVAKLTR
jgi:metallophosphoesterase superfamily enzyme